MPAQYGLELFEAQIGQIPERAQSATDARNVGTRAAWNFSEKALLNGVVIVICNVIIIASAVAASGTARRLAPIEGRRRTAQVG